MGKNNYGFRILNKIIHAGYNTEKEILALTLDKILEIPNINVLEITFINELQKAIKNNKVISFLGGNNEE